MSNNYAGNLRVSPDQVPDPQIDILPTDDSEPIAVLAGGCFWCTEVALKSLDGVLKITAGYSGGDAATADYRTVCDGNTGHAESIEVQFDPAKITYGQLLKYFFTIAHDPTQENRQGNDIGTQYRSAIFYRDEKQANVAQKYVQQLTDANIFSAPIKTQIVPLENFYPGEDYHQNYATQNPNQPYIAHVALPKAEKMRRYFADKLKAE